MRLSAAVLKNFSDSNNFEYAAQFEYNQGTSDQLYIQLTNGDRKLCNNIYQRYVPPAGSSVVIRIDHLNTACVIERIATVDPNDSSIWWIPLLATDKVGSGNIHITVTEPGNNIRKAVIKEGITAYPVDPNNMGYC